MKNKRTVGVVLGLLLLLLSIRVFLRYDTLGMLLAIGLGSLISGGVLTILRNKQPVSVPIRILLGILLLAVVGTLFAAWQHLLPR